MGHWQKETYMSISVPCNGTCCTSVFYILEPRSEAIFEFLQIHKLSPQLPEKEAIYKLGCLLSV